MVTRARDGRGGHHQVVRIGPGLLQRRPLPHAELVLLVDHHQAELGERHVLLDDRLRADDEVDLSGGDQLQQRPPAARSSGRRSAGPGGPGWRPAPFERQGMLPGEDFRGGHQHGLVAVGHRQQHGVDGHHGFAAAHVALQAAGSSAAGRPCRRQSRRSPAAGPRSARRGTGGGCGRRSWPWPPGPAPSAGRAAAGRLTANASCRMNNS